MEVRRDGPPAQYPRLSPHHQHISSSPPSETATMSLKIDCYNKVCAIYAFGQWFQCVVGSVYHAKPSPDTLISFTDPDSGDRFTFHLYQVLAFREKQDLDPEVTR